MRLSVILSTYQNAIWLERSLWGYAAQSLLPLEIIVADDGSTWETAAAIDRIRETTLLNVLHVWHEHLGFQKCAILNEAIRVARGDYLVFSDGDCVPRQDFLATHCRLAQRGRFLSGGTFRLPLETSWRAERAPIERGHVFSPLWLARNGVKNPRQLHLLAFSGRVAHWADRLTTTRATFNGHNASAWKTDILRVNGFNEQMQYGGLDRELGERLENASVRGVQVRHRAVCVHLDHARPYVDAEKVEQNRRLRQAIVTSGVSWTEFGIARSEAATPELVPDESAPPMQVVQRRLTGHAPQMESAQDTTAATTSKV